MKKVFTIVVSCLCVIGITVVAVWYAVDNQLIEFDNVYTSTSEETTSDNGEETTVFEPLPGKTNVDINGNVIDYPLISALLVEGAEAYIQFEEGNQCYYLKFNSMEITKEKGDFDACDDWEEAQDSQGNLNDEYSYVVCNITIKNLSDQTCVSNIANFWLRVLGGNDELRAYNSNKVINNIQAKKSYFAVEYEPNVEYTFNLAYIEPDEDLKATGDEIYLLIEESFDFYHDYAIIGKKQ